MGPAPALTEDEEAAVCSYVTYMADHGFPLRRKTIGTIVNGILKKYPRQCLIDTTKGPSEKWVRKFIRRHRELSERRPDPIDRDRASVSMTSTLQFYDLLAATRNRIGVSDMPCRF